MKKELDFIKKYKRIILIGYLVSLLIGFFCPWKALWEPIFGSIFVWTCLVGIVVGCYSMLG